MIRKFVCTVDTRFYGSTFKEELEIDTDDYGSEKEITDYVGDYVEQMRQENISIDWEEVERDEEKNEGNKGKCPCCGSARIN